MRWSSFTRTSSSVRAASMPLLDCERRGDNRIHVLLAAGRVVDAVVADLGRVAWGDLVDAELRAAHRAELAAEAVDEDLRALAGVGCRGCKGRQLRARQLGRDVGRLAGGDVDALGDQPAHRRRCKLDDVELAGADVEALGDAVADPAAVMAERDDLLLAGYHFGRDRSRRDALASQEGADRGHF